MAINGSSSSLTSFEEFCGNSPFWDASLLLDGSYPQFTECFKQVGLIWIPCMLFLVLSVPYMSRLISMENNPISAGTLAVAKTMCTMALAGVTIATLIVRAEDNDQDSIPDALYVSEGLKLASFVVATTMIQVERKKGLIVSPLLWFFLLVLLISGIIPFYSNIEEDVQDNDKFGYIIFHVYFGLVIVSFVFTSFAEKRNKTAYISSSGMQTPELDASMPSILTFWWMTGLVYKAFKKHLVMNDVFDLHPKDRIKEHMPTFEKKWAEENAKVKEYNAHVRRTLGQTHTSSAGKVDETSPLISPDKSKDKEKLKSLYRQTSLIKVLAKSYGPLFLFSLLLRTACDLLQFVTPELTESILDYVMFHDVYYEWRGYCLAGGFAVILTISSLGANFASIISRRVGINIKGVLMNAIYKKSLSVASMDEDFTAGEVINLMSIDCARIEQMAPFVYAFVSAPFQVGLAIYMLYDKLEEATFAGMAVIVLVFPINVFIGVLLSKNQKSQMRLKDDRMKMTNEVLNGIKVLKLYAWEKSFEEKISAIRIQEMNVVRSTQMAIAVIIYIFSSIPFMVQLTAFAVYIAVSDEGFLSPIIASVSMQLFSLLNVPLTIMPIVFPLIVQALVSIDRISQYLNKEDIDPDVVHRDRSADNAIEVKDGEFSWNPTQPPSLRNINVAIKPGSLVAVVGTVGCGKSSLLSAMMGEMLKLKGGVTLKDSIAYVPQEAWIQNATVRDNILFGSEFDHRKYDKIIEACALKSDLAILAGGDKTEIGEKGINISGGQKQRVSLARAVYSDNEIYLLDDPLSAVDSHVGKHIFEKVVSNKGVLKNKTRVLVTHGIHWLPMVDNIIVMKDGTVSEMGTYEELMSTDGVFAQFLKEHIQEMELDMDDEADPEVEAMKRSVLERVESVTGTGSLSEGSTSGLESGRSTGLRQRRKKSMSQKPNRRLSRASAPRPSVPHIYNQSNLEASMSMASLAPRAGERLVEEENEGSGKVKWEVYWYYLKAVGFNTVISGIILYVANAGARFFTGVWLSDWTSDDVLLNTSRSEEDVYDERTTKYLVVYGAAGISQGLFVLVFALTAAVKLTGASGIIHNRMLVNILRLPMAFFDTTPLGRIVNRFSGDVDVMDNMLPMNVKQILDCISQILGTVLTISYGTPIFLTALGPLAIIYVLIMVMYVPTSRQLRRLDAVTRSPIFAHFSETLSGVSSIRSYNSKDRFLEESRKRMDHNFKFYFASMAAQCWVTLWLQLLGNMVVFAAALFSVMSTDVDAGTVGVSISYATQMTSALQILVDSVSQIEGNIVAVERLKEYSSVTREADWVNQDHRPKHDWPQKGELTFNNYQTRYRAGLDLVLKEITCSIKPGEKIGIVGRTGAGKSSMTVALFRIIEAADGNIVIDGENISTLGLHDLRNGITILPQEPVIFVGSIRMNLDPNGLLPDKDLWNALEHCHLKQFVNGLPHGLDNECGEGGSNFSVGQRQLLCLGRTLLRKSKILVLDEATAAVDMETDELIQKTIREEFADNTVLAIAHRLNTIMDYDRVMVLDKGYIKEFASPSTLLEDKASIFYGMAKDAGLV